MLVLVDSLNEVHLAFVRRPHGSLVDDRGPSLEVGQQTDRRPTRPFAICVLPEPKHRLRLALLRHLICIFIRVQLVII